MKFNTSDIPRAVLVLVVGGFIQSVGNSLMWPLNSLFMHNVLGRSLTEAGTLLAIQAVFEETAANEREHAQVFYKLLLAHTKGETNVIHVDADYPLVQQDTLTNLRAAAAGEREEWAEIYSNFGDVAEKEGFPDVAKAFRTIAEVEKHHMNRFESYADGIANGTLFKKETPTVWKCTNCGYTHEGPEAPETCPACFHPQGYFEALPEKY